MDWRDYIRPVLTVLVGIGIVVLVIVFIFKLFFGGGSKPAPQLDLTKYADSAATVTLLVDAPTNLDQEHHQVKITVSQTQNEFDIISGYQGNVTDSRTYPNNGVAFGAFLASLQRLNFTKGNTNKSLADYRGYCPTGDRYVFTFNDGQTDRFTYWATSCGQGTYKGSRGATLDLFRNQVAQNDFNQLAGSIPLGF